MHKPLYINDIATCLAQFKLQVANWRQIWLRELSRVEGQTKKFSPLLSMASLPFLIISFIYFLIFFLWLCSHVVRFTYFGGWCDGTYSYVYTLIINLCLLFTIKCSLLRSNACFGLITLCLMLWFELSLGNAFEHINGEEHLMDFVSRDREKLWSSYFNSCS